LTGVQTCALPISHAPLGHIWSVEETVALADKAAAVIAGPEVYDERVFSRLPSLKLVCKVGAGYDTVNVADATARGIAVCTGAGTTAGAVAEFAGTVMLALARHLLRFARNVRAGVWQDRPAGAPVDGAVGGLTGTGAAGWQAARRGACLGAKVICYDGAPARRAATAQGAAAADLAVRLGRSDYILVPAAKTETSTRLIGRDGIALTK